MNDPLTTYLHDHFSGSHFAVKLLESLREHYRDDQLGKFASELCSEVKQDQQTLQEIIDRVGPAHFDLSEAAGWVAERASRLKLRRDDHGVGIGTFEALETLTLGIRGKWALWRALSRIAQLDARIPAVDFDALCARADDQYTRAEQQRLGLVNVTFSPQPK
ncbi:MAG: hypothetical protein JWO19_1229 [Bryobacterales bacterium]|jgi:hypothetical protein|nr:hypothetical protein [Bryobacterales bacterium]